RVAAVADAGQGRQRILAFGRGVWLHAVARRHIDRTAIHVAENDRQAALAAADHHDLGVVGARQFERRLDAFPAQIGIGNAARHDVLELADALGLDALALGFLGFAQEAVIVFEVELFLLFLAVDRGLALGRQG